MPTKTQSALRWKQLGSLLFSFAIAAAIWIAGAFWIKQSAWRQDFSQWQPPAVFQMALGQKPPPGVTDIKASGRHYFTKRWVWLRFQATDAAMRKLGFFRWPMSATDAHDALKERWSADSKYDIIDRNRVSWDDMSKIAHPVFYPCLTRNSSDWLWQGIVIFDHETHTVFVQAHGD